MGECLLYSGSPEPARCTFLHKLLANCLAWVCLIFHVSVLFMKILFSAVDKKEYCVIKEKDF